MAFVQNFLVPALALCASQTLSRGIVQGPEDTASILEWNAFHSILHSHRTAHTLSHFTQDTNLMRSDYFIKEDPESQRPKTICLCQFVSFRIRFPCLCLKVRFPCVASASQVSSFRLWREHAQFCNISACPDIDEASEKTPGSETQVLNTMLTQIYMVTLQTQHVE